MKRGDSSTHDKHGKFAKGNALAAKKGEVRSPDGGWATKKRLAEAREIVRERLLAEIERTGGAALEAIIQARLAHAATLGPGSNEAAAMIFDRLDGKPLAKTELSGGLQVLEGVVVDPSNCRPERALDRANHADESRREASWTEGEDP